MFKPVKTVASFFVPSFFLVIVLAAFSFAAAQSTPAQDQATPAQDQPKPAADQAKPATDQAKPAADEAKPAAPEAKPAAGKSAPTVQEPRLPALPVPVSGNAVAVYKSRGTTLLFSLMGMGAKKTWDSVTNAAFYLDPDWDQWYPLKSVPGTAGRIDAAAIAARGSVFLFGGVVVDEQNRGLVVPDVNVYVPSRQIWLRGSDLPIPVADAVIGVSHDRYIYLLGGRSNHGAVPNVQIFDAEKSRWLDGTLLPGEPVFGHAGALLEDTIVIVDGAYQNPSSTGPPFLASDQSWMGKIDRRDPGKIEWSKLPAHPGSARFGIAAGASEKDHKIYFSGGADNPDGDTGIGFDGKPAEPSPVTFAWDLRSAKWEMINPATPNPVMNASGLLAVPDGIALAGGLAKGQNATRRVTLIPIATKPRN